jgi:hypothetical protein
MRPGEVLVDEKHEARGIEYKPCVITDFSKIDIRDGVIHYRIYGQDGEFIPMTVRDTYSNRLLVSWIQIHDRYTPKRSASASEDTSAGDV